MEFAVILNTKEERENNQALIFDKNIFYHQNNCLFEFLAKCFNIDLCELISEYKSRAGERENLAELAETLNFLNRHGEEFSEFSIFAKKHEISVQTYNDRDGGTYCEYCYNALLNGFYYKVERQEYEEDEFGDLCPIENNYFIAYEQETQDYLSQADFLQLEKIA